VRNFIEKGKSSRRRDRDANRAARTHRWYPT
jgi:hypothetical protein